MIVSSFGSVQALAPVQPRWSAPGGLSLYNATSYTYAALYRTQPNIRICVDFLARNVAQLGLHVFRRVSDTDRVRLSDHGLDTLIRHPNPYTTRYRFFETLMQDLGVFFNTYWLKVQRGPALLGLVRLPPQTVEIEGTLAPTAYHWTLSGGRPIPLRPDQVFHMGGYDPDNPLGGLSPCETLRRVLAEDVAATEYRQHYWRNSARMEGVIMRPAFPAAPRWDAAQRAEWREQWQAGMAGGPNSGKTGLLEDGMTWANASHNAKDSEYTIARKLSREECAAEYHIPQPFVGILDHATFSNIKEQHKNLYQDTLGPWLVNIEEEFERQLLPDFADSDRVYVEFNIAEKLKGSFEEQASALRDLVGGPLMTRNEGRSRLNLPTLDDPKADRLITPLNVAAGDAPDDDGDPPPAFARRGPAPPDDDDADAPNAVAWATVLHACWRRQASHMQKVLPAERARGFDLVRWNSELAADLAPLFEMAGCSPDEAMQRAAYNAAHINATTRVALDRGEWPFAVRALPDYIPPRPAVPTTEVLR